MYSGVEELNKGQNQINNQYLRASEIQFPQQQQQQQQGNFSYVQGIPEQNQYQQNNNDGNYQQIVYVQQVRQYPQYPSHVVVPINNVSYINNANNYQKSTLITCPYCRVNGQTISKKVMGSCAWTACVFLFIFFLPGIFYPCCCCQDVQHTCGNCRNEVGRYEYQCC